jgi:ethanolamine-phosphate cytidylyltransferase
MPKTPVKIMVDGAFDLIHSGHYNAIRQASLMGDELVTAVCSDEGIR